MSLAEELASADSAVTTLDPDRSVDDVIAPCPLALRQLEVLVTDPAGSPVAGVELVLLDEGKEVRTRTDCAGVSVFAGLREHGDYDLVLEPCIAGACALLGVEKLELPARGSRPIELAAGRPLTRRAFTSRVLAGSRVRLQHPALPAALLRLQLLDEARRPRVAQPWSMEIEVTPGAPPDVRTGSTDREGFVQTLVDARATQAQLVVGLAPAEERFVLDLRPAPPSTELAGAA
ncbi:MAG: carboxypeptidase regulatory-like domain-containing protein, partial [Deltaproteobacteria bacterium]|nr:carboxypeptidase regulatory-like domain-containing protein [Deltaproteobacteria bacterium]